MNKAGSHLKRGVSHDARRERSAFTLVELLLVIMLIGIILAMLMPVLKGVRIQGERVAALSSLRQHSAIFAMYNNDWDDRFPFFAKPLPSRTTLTCEKWGPQWPIEFYYFGSNIWWNMALCDGYYDGDGFSHVFRHPAQRGRGYPIAWSYACCFIASPEYWNQATRMAPPAQLRPTRQPDVLHPALKILLTSRWDAYAAQADPRLPHLLAFVDGHAAAIKPDRIVAGVPTGDGLFPGYTEDGLGLPDPGLPGQHTIDGVRGIDVRSGP